MRDLKQLQEGPKAGVTAAPTDDNIMQWNALIMGEKNTIFERGEFELTIEFTEEYPSRPPIVKFVTKMFHPNVFVDGSICLDILGDKWCPAFDVRTILICIQTLLANPNPDDPANAVAAHYYLEHKEEYEREIRAIVEKRP